MKHIPLLPPAPAILASLLSGHEAEDIPLAWPPHTSAGLASCTVLVGRHKAASVAFKQSIRCYNSALGFASFSDSHSAADVVTQDALQASASRAGPPVYILHGRAYHIAGTLYPSDEKKPKFAQLYVFDPETAIEARLDSFDGLESKTLAALLRLLTEDILHKDPFTGKVALSAETDFSELVAPRNPYPAHFLNMHAMIQAHRTRHPSSTRIHALRLAGGEDKNPKTYNRPTSAEVSCTVVGEGPLPRHFISVYERSDDGSGSTHELSYLSEHVDPLTYPLIHVYGTAGYSHALRAPKSASAPSELSHVSMREFYAHRLMQRYSHDSGFVELPHSAGRLFQQYLVDAYSKVESQRLDWVVRNQSKLRVDSLAGLLDHLSSANDMSPCPPTPASASAVVGKPVILPATFGGSPRALHQNYLDSMSIVARFGKPDFLITITANPSWKEILSNLRPGETAADRPDLVARVFQRKLEHLLRLLTKEGFLGKAIAWTWVVEFQKRGLPHAHILLIVRSADKPTTPMRIDELISAELPDPQTSPELHRLVDSHMIHGPCGALNPLCPCMHDGVCTKNYPKKFASETQVKVGGYPEYRRRESMPLLTAKHGVLDTRSVVPHNLGLLEIFDCHLNVEVLRAISEVTFGSFSGLPAISFLLWCSICELLL